MPKRTLEDSPERLVEDGQLRFGSFRQPIRHPNLIDARAPFGFFMPRPLRSFRLKEWQAMQTGNGRLFMHIALFNAKLMSMVQVKIFDRESNQKYVFEKPIPGSAFKVAEGLYGTRTAYQKRKIDFVFENELERDELRVRLSIPKKGDFPGVDGELRLDTSKTEPQIVSIPFGDHRGMYSHKGLFPCEGSLDFRGESHAFTRDSGYAFIDDHKGYYDYQMQWDWLTGGAYLDDGTLVGINITKNASIDPERYHENCFWRNGKMSLLPHARFEMLDRGTENERWLIRDQEGKVDLRFEVKFQGDVRINALIVESRYRGPFGRIDGTLEGVDGERIELDGIFGMGEEFRLRV
ncbi:MAG: DUF2804 domain-containing protein [Sandaracinaceae bacterium]|nr:DUF2804 domain-containing protein [Sandaracinaceae bacterium]